MFRGEKERVKTTFTQEYACTVTLQPKCRCLNANAQYKAYTPMLEQQLRAKFPNCRLSMVAELTKTFDIHYHGIISFDQIHLGRIKNIPRYFRDMFRTHSTIGFVLLKVITEDNIWLDYLLKRKQEFYDDLEESSLICDDNDRIWDYERSRQAQPGEPSRVDYPVRSDAGIRSGKKKFVTNYFLSGAEII